VTMTLPEWTATIIAELRSAGFEASEYAGLPLAQDPGTIAEKIRFLKFRTSLAADRTIYKEGVLFVPAGTRTNHDDVQDAAAGER